MTELDIEAIAAEHLVQCGPCDYGLVEYACRCPKGDPRSAISRLIDEVRRLRNPRAWALQDEPGPEVKALRCACHPSSLWTRDSPYWIPDYVGPMGARRWRAVLVDHTVIGPLVDATGDLP